MPNRSRSRIYLLATVMVASMNAGTAGTASSALPNIGMTFPPGPSGILQAGHRRYHDDDEDGDFYYPPPNYDDPPPRAYRYAPPPAEYYDAPDYGWMPPPQPASCGKYRSWNGEYCADARYRPPYVGPRW